MPTPLPSRISQPVYGLTCFDSMILAFRSAMENILILSEFTLLSYTLFAFITINHDVYNQDDNNFFQSYTS